MQRVDALALEPLHKVTRGDTLAFFLTISYKVNVGHHYHIGLLKARGELFEQVPRSTVLVRLKYHNQSAPPQLRSLALSEGSQRDLNLGWVVPVVIKDPHRAPSLRRGTLTQKLHAPIRPRKLRE